jgi:hypothetical protein
VEARSIADAYRGAQREPRTDGPQGASVARIDRVASTLVAISIAEQWYGLRSENRQFLRLHFDRKTKIRPPIHAARSSRS